MNKNGHEVLTGVSCQVADGWTAACQLKFLLAASVGMSSLHFLSQLVLCHRALCRWLACGSDGLRALLSYKCSNYQYARVKIEVAIRCLFIPCRSLATFWTFSECKYCILSIGKKINVLHLQIYFQVKNAKEEEDLVAELIFHIYECRRVY